MNTYKGKPCAWCGELSIDGAHVPTKFLIEKSERGKLRGHWPVLPACESCNQGLKLDEEWFAIHFCSILYDFSDKAKSMFHGQISSHLRRFPRLVERYYRCLSIIELKVDGVSHGLKTRVEMGQEDWDRLKHVSEMFARGLYAWHSGACSKPLKALVVYLNPERFVSLSHHFAGLTGVPLFPNVFEYAYSIVPETKEAVFYIIVYNKPSFFICLTTPERHDEGEKNRLRKILTGEIDPNKLPGIEILG